MSRRSALQRTLPAPEIAVMVMIMIMNPIIIIITIILIVAITIILVMINHVKNNNNNDNTNTKNNNMSGRMKIRAPARRSPANHWVALLVYSCLSLDGLISFLRHYLSNTAN